MENLISDVKGIFAEQRLALGEGADTKYDNYAGMISICGVFLNIRNPHRSRTVNSAQPHLAHSCAFFLNASMQH